MLYKNRTLASIDIGTNSIQTLVGHRDDRGQLKILMDHLETPRLGQNLNKNGFIEQDSVQRAVQSLTQSVNLAKDLGANEFYAVSTAALRDAQNQDEVKQILEKALNHNIDIIEPMEEARLTYLSVTTLTGHDDPSLVLDIGGGSTEVSWGLGHRFDGARSLKFGTVSVLETFFSNGSNSQSLTEAKQYIDRLLSRITALGSLDHHYGTAGSFTLLASLLLGLQKYDSNQINGTKIKHQDVHQWIDRLVGMKHEDVLQLKGMDPKRADLMLPGLVIMDRMFEKFKPPFVEVVDRGLRFGKMFDVLRGFESFIPLTNLS